MIRAWLDLSLVGIFVTLTIAYGVTAVLIGWVAFWSPWSGRIENLRGIVAPYFTSVALLFSLLTGFLASDIMDRNKQAILAAQTESRALANLAALASAADMAAVRTALANYVQAIVKDEWPKMADAQTSPATDAALNALLRTLSDPRIATAGGEAVHNGLMHLTLQAATARSDRLALNSRQSDGVKWGTVLFLLLMTQVAIGMVLLDRRAPHLAAMAVFTVAAVVSLGLIAIQETPFDGALAIAPAPLEQLLKTTGS